MNRFLFILLLLPVFIFSCKNEEQQTTERAPISEYPQIEQLSAGITQNPTNSDLYAERAALYYEIDSYDNAINDLKKAIELKDDEVAYYHLLADVYLDYFRSRLALETLKDASKKFPEDDKTLLKLAEFQMILTKNNEAFKTIDKLLKRDPQNAEAYFMLGMNFKDTGDTIRAINSFQEAVDRNSSLVDGWIQLGNLYSTIDDPLALKYYDNAIRVAPQQVEPHHAKAYYLANIQNDLQAAIKVYEDINRIDPQYEEAYYNAGLIYLDLNQFQEAFKQFDLAIKFSPTHIRAYFYRGLANEFLGKKDAAKKDYEQALRMAPDYEMAKEQLEGLNG